MKLNATNLTITRKCLFILTLLAISIPLRAQQTSKADLTKQLLQSDGSDKLPEFSDLTSMRLSSESYSKLSGVTHLYFQQEVNEIPVYNAILDAHVTRDNQLLSFNHRFVSVSNSRTTVTPKLTPHQAVEAAAVAMGYEINGKLIQKESRGGPSQAVIFKNNNLSLEDIPVQLMWQPIEDVTDKNQTALRLAWDLNIYEIGAQNWWNIRIDALTGELLDKVNWVVHCSFESNSESCSHPHDVTHEVEHQALQTHSASHARQSAVVGGGSYKVFAAPLENPYVGPRTLIVDPADALASPYGWHDTDGAAGAEFTITQGNNVHAYADTDNDNLPDVNSSPNGGQALTFDYPLDLSQHPSSYQFASVTNLFYWNNYMHDLAYSFGFDESAGNFQQNNYGNGGSGGDYVQAEAQDGGGTTNANFATPPDGLRPRMQMYLGSNPDPDIDGSFDNGVVVHEYAHGISNRLTGGPATAGCLSNQEQMGEGWSDYFALITTMQPGDISTTPRYEGAYLVGHPVTGPGFRPTAYTTDMNVNPSTYETIKTAAVPHGVGYVWATMLWDMTWALIQMHGTSAGSDASMNLVMEGMKLQPCSPGFVDGRNAILMADSTLYGGANQCLIWQVFARRGLGFSASQGSSNSRSDGTQAFDLPTSLPCLSASPYTKLVCTTQDVGLDIVANSNIPGGSLSLSVTGEPAGVTHLFGTNNPLTPGDTSYLVMTADSTVPQGSYPITVTGNNGSGSFSTIFMLDVRTKPAATTLIAPVDGTNDLPTSTRTLTWNAVPGASQYVVAVWEASEPTPGPFSGIYTADTSFELSGLSNLTTYNWRISTYNSPCSGAESPIWSFTIDCAASYQAPTLLSPTDDATGVSVLPFLDWNDVPYTYFYIIEIATDSNFSNVVDIRSTFSPSNIYPSEPLNPNTEYYWRVRIYNSCNWLPTWSSVFSFTTDGIAAECDTIVSINVPVTIPSNAVNTFSSTIQINECGTIADIDVINLDISHSWTSLIEVELISPQNTTVRLWNRSCNSADMLINFDDESTISYHSWGSCPPPANIISRPYERLQAFDGQSMTGVWTLSIKQIAAVGNPNGSLNNWGLDICSIPTSGSIVTCYRDADNDSYGDPNLMQSACGTCQNGWVLDSTDCNDASVMVNPSVTEVCDFIDNDCNGMTDEGFTILTCYLDLDVDGYGTDAASKEFCGTCGIGYAPSDDDCDDYHPDVYPGATEICDLVDNNCDGEIDEGFDLDGDGYTSCGGDCNDNEFNINPGVAESCNGLDDDCNGVVDDFPVDEILTSTDVPIAIATVPVSISSTLSISGMGGFIYDLDVLNLNISHTFIGDMTYMALTSPQGTVVQIWSSVCFSEDNILINFDDESANAFGSFPCPPTNNASYQPFAPLSAFDGENPNGTWTLTVVDGYNGDGGSLNAWSLKLTVPATVFYADVDGDGYGDPNDSIMTCASTGYVTNALDCDDNCFACFTNATEICDGLDNNCDGTIDEGFVDQALYVNHAATGLNNGSSWTDAYTELQDALAVACPNISEIWVASGTYKPTTGTERTIYFVMKNNLAIYGGFAGGETLRSQRNWTDNVTILSGDIDTIGYTSDNSHNVLFSGPGLDSTAIIDGFTVTGAAGGGYSGGIYVESSSPTIRNCLVTGNSNNYVGGGMACLNASPLVTNCIFKNNVSTNFGGGLANAFGGAPMVINCLFIDNFTAGFGGGGGLYSQDAAMTLANCTFTENVPEALHCNSPINVHNSIFWGNVNSIYNATDSIHHCIVEGGYSPCIDCPVGNGNINPTFVSPTDLRLLPCSPALDAGDNSVNLLLNDVAGNPRNIDATSTGTATIDLGAYEFQSDITMPSMWTGMGDSMLWSDPLNWSDQFIPQPCRDIVIPSGNVTIPPGFDAIGNTLDVKPTATLVTDSTATLDIKNN